MRFIDSADELRALYGYAADGAVRKEQTRLDGHCKGFLSRSPFVLIGSQDAQGRADVTPKGDKPGFARVLDDQTIAIPDRPGNNRLDTWMNVLANPAVGLLFLIPGMNETLRVNGRARLTTDDALREQLSAEGKKPVSVLVVAVESAFMHCAKAFMRSDLWKPGSWPARETMPTLGKILKDQLALPGSVEDTDRWLDDIYRQEMW